MAKENEGVKQNRAKKKKPEGIKGAILQNERVPNDNVIPQSDLTPIVQPHTANELASEKIEQQLEMEEKYGMSEDGALEVPGIHTRHPNRNEDKGRMRTESDARRKSVVQSNSPEQIQSEEQPTNYNRSLTGSSPYFFVLILSKKQAKLFKGDEFHIRHVDLPEMPNGIADVVHLEEKEGNSLFRTGSSGAGGGANYHGIGSGAPDEKENIALYLKEVDRTLWKEGLSRENVPLVVGGVEYLVTIFRNLTQYKHVWNEILTGSLENSESREIHAVAKELLIPYFEERTSKALELYGNQSASKLVSTSPEEIVSAAHFKRVSHLFVPTDNELWGTFDEKRNNVEIHQEKREGDIDLREQTIRKTMDNGGEVHILPKDRVPDQAPMAAVMRFQLL